MYSAVSGLLKARPAISGKHPAMLQLMHKDYLHTPLSIARYLFIQLSELEQRRVKKLSQCLTWQHKIHIHTLFYMFTDVLFSICWFF